MLVTSNPVGPVAPGESVHLRAFDLSARVGAVNSPVFWSAAPAPSVQIVLRSTSSDSAVFQASEPGTYTLTAVSSPAVRSFDIRVYGPPAAVVLTPSRDKIPADSRATETIEVQVVDSLGAQVGSFVGDLTLTDTNGQLCGSNRAVVAVNGGSGRALLCAASRPGTDKITAGQLVAYPGSGYVPGVSYGTARVTDAPVAATHLVLAAISGGMRRVVARGSNGIIAARPVTWVDASRSQPVTVAIAVYDDANDPLADPETVMVHLSGPGSLSPFAKVTSANLSYPSAASFTVYNSPGRPGTIAITATAPGLPAARYNVQAIASGPPAHFLILVSRGFDDRGMPFNLYDVTVVDAGRQPEPALSGEIEVSDNSASQPSLGGEGTAAVVYAPAASVQDAVAYRPGPASFPIMAGSAVFAIESRPGSATPATMTITDPALGLSAHPRYVWATGRAATVMLTRAEPPTAQVTDANGNPVAEAGLPVLFTIGSTQAWALTDAEGIASVASPNPPPYTVSAFFDQHEASGGAVVVGGAAPIP